MEGQVFRHLWGLDRNIEQVIGAIANGPLYRGIEAGPIWLDEKSFQDLKNGLAEKKLAFIGMIFTDLPFRPLRKVEEHVDEFKRQLEKVIPLNPIKINIHGGKDFWLKEECEQFLEKIIEIEKSVGVDFVFETHRGRMTFSPWKTYEILEMFPDLKLCADFSHWICVAERLFEGWEEDKMKKIFSNVDHIHARVGYEQGPQVVDPREAYWEHYLIKFESWWRQIVEINKRVTLAPEYGPVPYWSFDRNEISGGKALEEIVDWSALRAKKYWE